MQKNLVFAGGGHAHMMALSQLEVFVEKGYSVTVIGPSQHHYYSGMGPGMLGQIYDPSEIRFATKYLVEKKGGHFVQGKVVKIDAEQQKVYLDSDAAISYDVLSCNLGSQVPQDIIQGDLADVFLVKPIERLLEAQQRILELGAERPITIGVVGGGPSAVEIAGNLWRLGRHSQMHPLAINILTSTTIMPHHPSGIRDKALKSLNKRGIQILEKCSVSQIRTGCVVETSGIEHAFDIIFVAIGVKPNPVFKHSGLPTGPDGGLLVNRYLQSTEYENIFGGGDCIYFKEAPLDKVGVYAVRQNPVLLHNLLAALEGSDLTPFDPGGDYLLIFNLGDDTGIFHKWRIQFGGRLAFRVKDYIDRKFMREFQAFEQ
jgi:NADH dehydrogenase FAD-containing subunit